MDGKRRDSDTASQREGLAVQRRQFRQHCKGRHAPSQSFGCAKRPVHGGVRKNEGKFLSPVPGGEIACSGEAASWALQTVQQPADFTEHLIAHRVSVDVVDLFEIVEIDEEQ